MPRKVSGQMPWFRAYAEPMLHGSVPLTMGLAHQMIWWKLLALARLSKCGDGTLRHGVGVPMKREWIAGQCGCTIGQLQEVIDIGTRDRNLENDGHRIKIWDDGTIELCNFTEYNPLPTPRQKTEPEHSPTATEEARKAIHDKYQREHPLESAFTLEAAVQEHAKHVDMASKTPDIVRRRLKGF